MDSQDTEDGQETTSESVSDKKKVPSFPSPKTDVVKRVRPKMVRQAPIDLDSDSSESRHQAISTEFSSLKIGSPMQNQLNNERAIQNVMGKSSSLESDTTFTSIVTNVRRQGSQRKHSLINQDVPEPS